MQKVNDHRQKVSTPPGTKIRKLTEEVEVKETFLGLRMSGKAWGKQALPDVNARSLAGRRKKKNKHKDWPCKRRKGVEGRTLGKRDADDKKLKGGRLK